MPLKKRANHRKPPPEFGTMGIRVLVKSMPCLFFVLCTKFQGDRSLNVKIGVYSVTLPFRDIVHSFQSCQVEHVKFLEY